MSADVNTPTLPDSRPLHRLIARTRRLLRSSWVATGLGITIGLMLGSLVVLAVLDLFIPLEPITLPGVDLVVPLDPILRSIALFLVVVPSVLAFLHGVVRPLFRRLGPTQVARRIESQLPGIHNRLVSAIDLETNASARPVSPVFLRRLITEALDRIRTFRPGMILDRLSLRRAALASGLAIVVAAVAWGLFADRLPTALARIFLPLADIPPASGIAYAVEPGTTNLLRSEEITFTARVSAGEPNDLRLELYGTRGNRPHRYELERDRNDPSTWRVVVDGASLGAGFENGFSYRVYGGRTWSKQHRVVLVDRPVITEMNLAVHYPKYMRIPGAQAVPADADKVAGPEGGHVEVAIDSQHQVSKGEIQVIEPTRVPIPREKQEENAWFEDKVPTGARSGGTWDWQAFRGKLVHTSPPSVGTYGHWFQDSPEGKVVGKNDVLFAHVFIPEGKAPETIMLEWHDGDGWEHRAFWGKDRIREGKAGTSSRHHVGALPPEGKWVRLEVPAARVDLEGKLIRGIAFKLHGGQAFWGRNGNVQVEKPGIRVVRTFPLEQAGEDRWVGRLPLTGKEGRFRAELRNEQGHPSKPSKELDYVVLPDNLPYVSLKQSNPEVVLSKPAALPLSVAAFDDYGLDEVRLLVRDTATAAFRSRTLWSAGASPLRTLGLDRPMTEASALKLGGSLRYLIEARDTKGQTARTPEYVLRIAAEAASADQQAATFDKTQDTFTDRLVKLMAEQKKVKSRIDELNKQHAKLTEKLEAARSETPPAEKGRPEEKTKPAEKDKGPKWSPEEMKQLAEVQKELAKLAGTEDALTKTAEQLNQDLKRSTEEANKLDLIPQALVDQMSSTQRLFERAIAGAMRDLTKDLKADSTPKTGTPDLKGLEGKANKLDKDLDGIKDRLDALSKARKDRKDELEKTLATLAARMAAADAKRAMKDLEDLKDLINKLREQMKLARSKSDDLDGDAEAGKDPRTKKSKKEDLDREIEKLLARAKKLLDKGDKDGDKPEFPDAPYRADEKESKVPPREQDSDEPLPNKKGKEKDDTSDGKTSPDGKKKDDGDEDEPKFMPRLGGPKPKLDPRYKGKERPMKSKAKDGKDEGDEKEKGKSRDLDAAEKSLGSDQDALENLLDRLQGAMKGNKGKKGKDGEEGDESEASKMAAQLRSLMQSRSMREAMAMAAAAQMAGKGQQPSRSERRPDQPPTPTQRDVGNLQGGDAPGANQGNLAKLDPATRAMILKLPPSRYREELIRGLNEQGPEAYRAFIQDYFKRLTETRTPGK